MIQRPDVEELLRRNGDYLLRKTDLNGDTRLALSVLWDKQTRHFIIQEDSNNGTVYMEEGGPRDQDIESLIRTIQREKRPVTSQSGVLLKRAIPREEWVLPHEAVTLGKKIGEGQFGEVYTGQLKTASGNEIEVAIKTLREAGQMHQKGFLAEARIMRQLRHENVIRIHGVAVYETPFMICMELCEGGSLLKQLRTKTAGPEQKLKWAQEAAKDLEYIARKDLVHRDIAARNCLLATRKMILKIADFGLTTTTQGAKTEVTGKVPVKWLAKETLEFGAYSMQSDVWAFGVLCWEIYADGAEPYPGMTNQQTRAMIQLHGHRMEVPNNTPRRVASLMLRCWETNPRDRPTCTDIRELLDKK